MYALDIPSCIYLWNLWFARSAWDAAKCSSSKTRCQGYQALLRGPCLVCGKFMILDVQHRDEFGKCSMPGLHIWTGRLLLKLKFEVSTGKPWTFLTVLAKVSRDSTFCAFGNLQRFNFLQLLGSRSHLPNLAHARSPGSVVFYFVATV